MKIGYKVFGQNSLNYGLAYCLFKNGIVAEPVTEKTAKYYDVVLFSIFWWQHVYDFVDFCNKSHIGKQAQGKTRVVVGGFNSFNPVVFKKYAHAVCVGDGEDVILDAIHERQNKSIFTGVEKEVVYNQCDITKNEFIYSNEANIARIEIARGCKYKCKFCQLAALKKYREVDFKTINKTLSYVKSKRVALFAPNKTSHSQFPAIIEALKSSNKVDVVPDVRFNDVEKFYSNTGMQIGIEGISERLRFSIGKALTNKRFYEIIQLIIDKALSCGKKPVLHCGYIFDLPGECEEDWKEFSDFLDGIQSLKNASHFNMFFVFNLFMPSPFTVLEDAEIHIERTYNEMVERTYKSKRFMLQDRRFHINVKGRLFGNYSRILSMITTRGGDDTTDIINSILSDKSIRALSDRNKILPLKYILKNYGGIERFVGVPKNKPWNIVKI